MHAPVRLQHLEQRREVVHSLEAHRQPQPDDVEVEAEEQRRRPPRGRRQLVVAPAGGVEVTEGEVADDRLDPRQVAEERRGQLVGERQDLAAERGVVAGVQAHHHHEAEVHRPASVGILEPGEQVGVGLAPRLGLLVAATGLGEHRLDPGQVPPRHRQPDGLHVPAEHGELGVRLREPAQLEEGIDAPDRFPLRHRRATEGAAGPADACRQRQAFLGVVGVQQRHLTGPGGANVGERIVGEVGLGEGRAG